MRVTDGLHDDVAVADMKGTEGKGSAEVVCQVQDGERLGSGNQARKYQGRGLMI